MPALSLDRYPKTASLPGVILIAFVAFFVGSFPFVDAREATISQDEFKNSLFVATTGDVESKSTGELKKGDRLISIDGHPAHELKEVKELVKQAGEKPVAIVVERPSESGFEQVTVEITPGVKHKLGIGFLKAHEAKLFCPDNEAVVVAESPQRIEKEKAAHRPKSEKPDDLLLLESETKVLAVTTLRTMLPWSEVYVIDGPHKGEILYAKSESVRPKSYRKRGISWLFYIAVLASLWWLISIKGSRNAFGILTLMAIGAATRLMLDMVEPPFGFEPIWKLALQGTSLICQLIVFFTLSKWSKEGTDSGESAGGAGIFGAVLLLFMPLLLAFGTVYNFFREIGQPKELPASAADDLSRALKVQCDKWNRKQKDAQRHCTVKGQSIEYKDMVLKWAIEKRMLHVVAAARDKVDNLLKRAIEVGEDSKYDLGRDAVYIDCWKGFISKKDGKQEILWGDVETASELASGIVYEFVDEADYDPDEDGDEGDESEFEEWLSSPDWKAIETLTNGAWPPGFNEGAVAVLNQFCAGRSVSLSEKGALISLESSEKLSEAYPQGPGRIAIVYHGYPELIRELTARLNPLGIKVVYNDSDQEKLFIYKHDDQFHCLRLQGHVAYHSASQVIRKLKDWDETYGLSLRVVGFGSDWVDAEINKPADLAGLAEDILRFCPDILEQEMEPHKVLVEELGESNRIHLWWD